MCLAVPGRIESISGSDPLLRAGKVSFAGVVRDVNLTCVPEAVVGDYVLVHVGMALSVVDEAEAQKIFEALEAIDGFASETGDPA